MQSAPATLTDAERATRLKTIDTKEKQLNREAEDAQTAYNADLQEAYGKIAAKVSATLKKYVSDNGYTLLLDVSSQQSNVMWANQSTDVTQAVVTAYNTSSGVAAPAPSAPASASSAPTPSTQLRSRQLRRHRRLQLQDSSALRYNLTWTKKRLYGASSFCVLPEFSPQNRIPVEKLVDRR